MNTQIVPSILSSHIGGHYIQQESFSESIILLSSLEKALQYIE
jgi:hypothetical protein